MARNTHAPVVVAVNGSPASERAVEWAAAEARRRGLPLRVVYAFAWPLYHSLPRDLPGFDVDEFALRIVDLARRRALELEPGLDVETAYIAGDPEPVLLEESRKAHMLVLGAHHRTAVDAVLPGSTALELLVSASCPVIVVPDRVPKPPTERVLVGVDGSESARAALEWAFPAADARGAALRAVTVLEDSSWWRFGALEDPSWTRTEDEQKAEERKVREEARRLVSEAVADERERWPRVRVEEVVESGNPAEALCAAARDCDLMVVGSHGRGGFAGMLLGSVSRNVISHSPCPVAVVRLPRHRRGGE